MPSLLSNQVHCPCKAWKSWPSTTGLQTCTRTSRPAKRRMWRPAAKAPARTMRTLARLPKTQATPKKLNCTWTSEDEKALDAAFQQAEASKLPSLSSSTCTVFRRKGQDPAPPRLLVRRASSRETGLAGTSDSTAHAGTQFDRH